MNETKNQLIQTGFTLDRLHQDGKIDNEAYTILKDRNKQAINYSQCCKSDSELLPDVYLQELSKVEWIKQTQASLNKQLQILRQFANKLGLYDASDYLKR